MCLFIKKVCKNPTRHMERESLIDDVGNVFLRRNLIVGEKYMNCCNKIECDRNRGQHCTTYQPKKLFIATKINLKKTKTALANWLFGDLGKLKAR